MRATFRSCGLGLKAVATTVACVFMLTGCVGVPTAGEQRARQQHTTVERMYRPDAARPTLPTLSTNGSLDQFVLFAMLNDPQVEAAYYDWGASVERITVERSLPDPRLSFEATITDLVLMTLMPGLMVELSGSGKLPAAANVATADSELKYFAFEARVLQTAFALKKACYQLNFLDAKINVMREMARLLGQLEQLALIQNEVGRSSLQDVLQARIEKERLNTEIENLRDSRHAMLAQFKGALGLKAEDATPPLPRLLEATPRALTAELLVFTALARNPRLKAMQAEVQLADASLQLARKSRTLDFSAGIEVDVKAKPLMLQPSLGLGLPIWRDKIAAEIAGAQAGKSAAQARFSAEQIALAVELAEKSFMLRETDRQLDLLNLRLLTMARQSLALAQSAYVGAKADFMKVINAERTLLDFQLSEVEARYQRELVLNELSLLILANAPSNALLLPPKEDVKSATKL